MTRQTRYQGAIVRDHQLLLIAHREHESGRVYWLIPGGGREEGETEEEAVIREMREETNLEVRIERLLFEEILVEAVYEKTKTYLCAPVRGEAKPGYEPEVEASSSYGIVEVRWFDLRDEMRWDEKMRADHITYPLVKRIQLVLGYAI